MNSMKRSMCGEGGSNGDRESLNGVYVCGGCYGEISLEYEYCDLRDPVMTERGTMYEVTSPTDIYGVGSCGLLKNDNDVCCERRENIINGLLMSEDDFPRRMDAVW